MSKIEKAYSMTNIGSVAPLSKSEVLIGQGHKTDLTTQLGLRGLCRSSLWMICSMMKISTLHALKKSTAEIQLSEQILLLVVVSGGGSRHYSLNIVSVQYAQNRICWHTSNCLY